MCGAVYVVSSIWLPQIELPGHISSIRLQHSLQKINILDLWLCGLSHLSFALLIVLHILRCVNTKGRETNRLRLKGQIKGTLILNMAELNPEKIVNFRVSFSYFFTNLNSNQWRTAFGD